MAVSFCKKNDNYSEKIIRQKQIKEIKKEIFRKTIHLCTAIVPFALKNFYWPTIVLLFLALILYIVCEYLRMKGKTIPVISKITDIASRKRDENHFVLGPVTLVIGILLSALIFPPIPATVGILALAFGDGLASLFGKLFGHVIIPFSHGKTVAGSLTCFIAIFITSYLTCLDPLCSLFLGVLGMVIEVFCIKDFDNIAIPVSMAFICNFFV